MRIVHSTLVTGLCLAIAACGGGQVRGQPPLVGVSTLNLEGQAMRARVDVYNPNSVNMEVNVLEMSMTLGEVYLGRHNARPGIDIHPNGTEEIRVDFPANDRAGELLAALERGDTGSIAYSVSGEVRDAQGGTEQFKQDGYFYPVPGRPGQFRGAGPQRDRPRER